MILKQATNGKKELTLHLCDNGEYSTCLIIDCVIEGGTRSNSLELCKESFDALYKAHFPQFPLITTVKRAIESGLPYDDNEDITIDEAAATEDNIFLYYPLQGERPYLACKRMLDDEGTATYGAAFINDWKEAATVKGCFIMVDDEARAGEELENIANATIYL